ncbi:hypothetical protein ACHAW6_012591 [Cyclotella cf. meneghiniana]
MHSSCTLHVYNTAPVLDDGTSREENCPELKWVNMWDNHTFGCPVYALSNVLASGKSLPKWSPRARLGINLGPSPHHAQNIYLVLNLDTSLCSPQFHCQYNDFFKTITINKPDTMMSSNWQILAGLESPNKIPCVKQLLQVHNCASVFYAQRVSLADFGDNDSLDGPEHGNATENVPVAVPQQVPATQLEEVMVQ